MNGLGSFAFSGSTIVFDVGLSDGSYALYAVNISSVPEPGSALLWLSAWREWPARECCGPAGAGFYRIDGQTGRRTEPPSTTGSRTECHSVPRQKRVSPPNHARSLTSAGARSSTDARCVAENPMGSAFQAKNSSSPSCAAYENGESPAVASMPCPAIRMLSIGAIPKHWQNSEIATP